jgi:ATP-dependent helicase HrpA
VDEHGRQLGMGRNLATLKADLGGQARSAFQALAALKLGSVNAPAAPVAPAAPTAASGGGARRVAAEPKPATAAAPTPPPVAATYTAWTFGELPELMEIRKGNQTLVGFPALIDKLSHVEIEVFDEPLVAAARHRAGLRRLVALAIKEPL